MIGPRYVPSRKTTVSSDELLSSAACGVAKSSGTNHTAPKDGVIVRVSQQSKWTNIRPVSAAVAVRGAGIARGCKEFHTLAAIVAIVLTITTLHPERQFVPCIDRRVIYQVSLAAAIFSIIIVSVNQFRITTAGYVRDDKLDAIIGRNLILNVNRTGIAGKCAGYCRSIVIVTTNIV